MSKYKSQNRENLELCLFIDQIESENIFFDHLGFFQTIYLYSTPNVFCQSDLSQFYHPLTARWEASLTICNKD